MRRVLLSVFAITLFCELASLLGCGSSPNGGIAPSVVVTHPPGSTAVSYTMTASISEPGDNQSNATVTITSNQTLKVPGNLAVLANASESGRATLTMGSVQAYYFGVTNGTYVFHDCTGCVAGQSLSVPSGSTLTLMITTGYVTHNTIVQAVVAGTTP